MAAKDNGPPGRSVVHVYRCDEQQSELSADAYQASKLAKEYENQGGDYENESGSKNEPKKGAPEHKSENKKKMETDDD